MPLHHRNFLTLDEVQERWRCSANDLKNLIVDGYLVPSFVINHVAFKVRFSWQADCVPPYWLPVVVETKTDEELSEPLSNLHDVDGMYYLVHPWIEAPLDCRFLYFSKDRDHQMGSDDANVCFMLNPSGKHPLSQGISLQMAFEKGGLTMDEVLRYENSHDSYAAPRPVEQQSDSMLLSKPLSTRERNTLLTIIAVLCKDLDYDTKKHAKTAGLIHSTAAEMGLSIGESTIEGHLKKIPDALAARMK